MHEVTIKFTLHVTEDKIIELTEAEARVLYNKLHELFSWNGYDSWRPVCPRPIEPYYISPTVDPNPIQYPYIVCEKL
jgi:hypothetical protein